jgi:hypothetical protein
MEIPARAISLIQFGGGEINTVGIRSANNQHAPVDPSGQRHIDDFIAYIARERRSGYRDLKNISMNCRSGVHKCVW